MKKRLVSIVLTAVMLLGLAPVFSINASASTSYVSDADDPRISTMLKNIEYQNFKGSGINVSQAQNYMKHFMFSSDFAAIGGGTFNYPNSGAYTYHVNDGTYSKDIRGSTGCCAYSYFVSKVVYNDVANENKMYLSSFGYTAAGLKSMLQRYAQAGEHLRADPTHSVAFISCDENGFYCFSYCGDSNPHIRLDYWTYSAYVSYYAGYSIFLYNANTADNSESTCAGGHNYGSSYSVSVTPTESKEGKISCYCTRCGAAKDVTLPKLNTTDYSYKVLTAAGCSSDGTARYTWKNTSYGTFSFDVKLPASSHSYSYSLVTAPTEITEGQIKGVCSKCKNEVTVTLPPFNNEYDFEVIGQASCTEGCILRYTWKNTQYGSYHFDKEIPPQGHAFYDCTVSKAPTVDSEGLLICRCFNCSDSINVTLPRLNDTDYTVAAEGKASCTEGITLHYTWNNEQYGEFSFDRVVAPAGHHYENGICSVCGAKDPDYKLSNPFLDVKETDNYYDAILWAYYHTPKQITGGFDATHFQPGANCTRGQVVTFLWRANGCPEPQSVVCPFSDVSAVQANGKENPYYKAILWAAEKGITTGYPGGLFKPNDTVTRAQFVTFLWRAEGEPSTSGTVSGFKDASTIASAYRTAIAWAVEKGITTGYNDGTFRPNATCTRWAVVLFMYRDMGD